MKKRLFGGLIVAGALTLWSSVGILAGDEEGLHGPGSVEAAAAIAALDTNSTCNPDLSSLSTLSTKDPERAKELIAGLKEKIAEIKADTKERILSALEQYQELLRDSRDGEDEDGGVRATPQLPDFMAMVTAACAPIANLVTQTAQTIQNLPAPKTEQDDERDHESSAGERD